MRGWRLCNVRYTTIAVSMFYSRGMFQPPWKSATYRDRHGRGQRTPMFGTRLPRYRTSSGMFDDLVLSQVRRLAQAWPDVVQHVQFAVEDVPPTSLAPWEAHERVHSQAFPAAHGLPARIVLYRLPLQMHAATRIELQFAIRDELVQCLAQLRGCNPEDIDPQWGMQ